MTLLETMPSWTIDGIFNNINVWASWNEDETITAEALNMDYYGNHSGLKEISPLVKKMVWFNQGHILTAEDMQKLDAIIKAKYKLNWDRLWYALQKEYEPLENYNSIEEYTPDVTTTQSYNTDKTDTSKTSENTHIDNTVNNRIKGLGASSYSDVGQTDTDSDTTRAKANNEIESRTQGDAENNFVVIEHEGKDTTKKSGNIGVTSSQQMLEQEFELRKRNFFDYVYNCIDEVLTIDYWKRGNLI